MPDHIIVFKNRGSRRIAVRTGCLFVSGPGPQQPCTSGSDTGASGLLKSGRDLIWTYTEGISLRFVNAHDFSSIKIRIKSIFDVTS